MGRTYQAEPAVQDFLQDLLAKKATFQVGVLLGKQNVGARDVVTSLVRTPNKGEDSPIQMSGSGSSKSRAKNPASGTGTLSLDIDWIADHATQLTRTLPGGVVVLGCFLFASDAAYQSSVPQLCSVVEQLREHLPENASEDLMILHADANVRKITARSLAPGASQPTPAEIKFAPVMSNLLTVTCSWHLDVSLAAANTTSSLMDQLQDVVEQAEAQITSSIACTSGNQIPGPDTIVGDVQGNTSQGIISGISGVAVQLIPVQGVLDDRQQATDQDTGRDKKQKQRSQPEVGVSGHGRLRGWLTGVAVAHKRQAWSSVIAELKADLISSLHSRLDLLEEDALAWQEEQKQQQQEGQDKPKHPLLKKQAGQLKAYSSALPYRAALPLSCGLPVTDYLLPGDGTADVAARAVELFGGASCTLGLGSISTTDSNDAMVGKLVDKVTLIESEGAATKKVTLWDPNTVPVMADATSAAGADQGGSKVAGAGSSSACSSTVIGGALAGVAAAVAGLAMYFSGMSTN